VFFRAETSLVILKALLVAILARSSAVGWAVRCGLVSDEKT
jgi:hypothetical protein